jgi:hypothetical protein
MKMNADLLKKMKNAIYSKPLKSYNQFYTINKNYNNMLINLLDDSKLNKNKNIMISELDIKLNSSQSESYDKIDLDKKNIINTNKNEAKTEFKKQLTENLIKYLQKNEKNNNSNDIEYKNKNKKDIILKAKKALNLTSITPSNNRYKKLDINKSKEKNNNYIKINRKNTKTNTNTIKNKDTIKKNVILIKKVKSKNIHSILSKFNYTTNKKTKKNNPIYNQPHNSLLGTMNKKFNTILSINDSKKSNSNYSNIKFNKNKSFVKDSFNKSNTLRNSLKNSFVNNNFILKYHKILNSNSKPKERKIHLNNQYKFFPKIKYAKTENSYNTTKNMTSKKCDINRNKFTEKKLVPIKYRNLTLKEINILNNFNLPKNNCSSFFNSTFTKEKDKNFSTIICEKQKLKKLINKKLKLYVKNKLKNVLNKNPINIVNININKNNNYIMNINNSENSNISENKKRKASYKNESQMKKLRSFKNYIHLNDHYKQYILKRIINKEKLFNNKDKKRINLFSK